MTTLAPSMPFRFEHMVDPVLVGESDGGGVVYVDFTDEEGGDELL